VYFWCRDFSSNEIFFQSGFQVELEGLLAGFLAFWLYLKTKTKLQVFIVLFLKGEREKGRVFCCFSEFFLCFFLCFSGLAISMAGLWRPCDITPVMHFFALLLIRSNYPLPGRNHSLDFNSK
jgi:hypothetical protein